MIICTRKAAKVAGLKQYYTGTPCKHGHIDTRQTVNGRCCECGRIASLIRQKALWAQDPDGMRARHREHARKYPERAKARHAAWKENNLEHVADYGKSYYSQNAESIKKRTNRYHHANHTEASRRSKEWRAANPSMAAANAKKSKVKRRASERNAEFELVTITDIIKRDGLFCYICGTETDTNAAPRSLNKAELEHVISLSNGGSHTWGNLRCACFRCNRIKGSRLTPERTREIVLGRLAATRPTHALVLVNT